MSVLIAMKLLICMSHRMMDCLYVTNAGMNLVIAVLAMAKA
jgi:hypothetical protein